MENVDAPSSIKKRGGGRKPTSCRQCRQRKVKCSLGQPCSTCILRGDATTCTLLGGLSPSHFSEALPYLSPAKRLRSLVDRLEHSVNKISLHETYPDQVADRDVGTGNGVVTVDVSNVQKMFFDLKEVEGVVRDPMQDLGRPQIWGGTGVKSSRNDVLEILPTKAETNLLIDFASSLIPPSIPIYDKHRINELATKIHSNPSDEIALEQISLLLAICGLCLAFLPTEKRSEWFHEGRGSDLLAKTCIDGALTALALSDTISIGKSIDGDPETPILIMIYLFIFWISLRDGEWLESSRTLWEMTISKSLDLGLHRKSHHDEDPPRLHQFLFWVVFYLDAIMMAFSSKAFVSLDPARAYVYFPPPTSPMHIRHSISLTLHKISTNVFFFRNPTAVPYRTINLLNEELKILSGKLPQHYLRIIDDSFKPYRNVEGEDNEVIEYWSMIAFGFTRLNRIFLYPGVVNSGDQDVNLQSHWSMVIYYSKLSMALKVSSGLKTWPNLFARLEGAVTLALVLQSRPADRSARQWKRDLDEFLQELKNLADPSRVVEKGINIIENIIMTPSNYTSDDTSGSLMDDETRERDWVNFSNYPRDIPPSQEISSNIPTIGYLSN